MVNGKLTDGFSAALDVTQKGIVINSVYMNQDDYFENKNIMLYSYKMDETTQKYEWYGMKDLQTEDASMMRGETGKYRIFILNKFKSENILSDIIKCEIKDSKVTSLKIVDKNNNLLKTIDNIELASTLNLIDEK